MTQEQTQTPAVQVDAQDYIQTLLDQRDMLRVRIASLTVELTKLKGEKEDAEEERLQAETETTTEA